MWKQKLKGHFQTLSRHLFSGWSSPRLQLPEKSRSFEEVVGDMKQVVFSILRFRPTQVQKQFQIRVLGSGFFISPTAFLTCHHVVNHNQSPHVDGDNYHLVRRIDEGFMYHHIPNMRLGQNLFLEQGLDIALLVCNGIEPQRYANLDWGDVREGREIGVLGYPLGQVSVVGGRIDYGGLLPRVSKGTVTSRFTTDLKTDQGVLPNISLIEVSFLFVSGNSGGPVFDARTGKVVGFVNSYNAIKIKEQVETASVNLVIPKTLQRQYIDTVQALYSYAIRVTCVRDFLLARGVI